MKNRLKLFFFINATKPSHSMTPSIRSAPIEPPDPHFFLSAQGFCILAQRTWCKGRPWDFQQSNGFQRFHEGFLCGALTQTHFTPPIESFRLFNPSYFRNLPHPMAIALVYSCAFILAPISHEFLLRGGFLFCFFLLRGAFFLRGFSKNPCPFQAPDCKIFYPSPKQESKSTLNGCLAAFQIHLLHVLRDGNCHPLHALYDGKCGCLLFCPCLLFYCFSFSKNPCPLQAPDCKIFFQ